MQVTVGYQAGMSDCGVGSPFERWQKKAEPAGSALSQIRVKQVKAYAESVRKPA